MTTTFTHKNIVLIGSLSLLTKILFVAYMAQASIANASPAPESFADLADKLLPTVVNISSTQKIEEEETMQRRSPFGNRPGMPQFPEGHPFNDFFDDFFGRQFPMQPQQRQFRRDPISSLGSGFIVDIENGLIITNNHVIDGADEIKIKLHDDTILPAEVIGTDEKTDLALLKADLKGEKVNVAKFGDSDVMRVGDWVIAIGNPFGLGGTVTAGIISARQRDINSGPYDDYIQTDASINRGNSGGPMFNMNGEVIGINTAIFSPTGGSVGIGFAIPSVLAEPVIDQLNKYGRTKRGWLGVKIQEVTEDIADSLGLAKPAGALVAEVTPTGPAEKAGIEAGDIILAFDNKPVREMRNLPLIVAETDIDRDVTVIVWRDGKRVTLKANIGELEKAEDEGLLAAHDGNRLDGMNGGNDETSMGTEIPQLGLFLNGLNDALREEFNVGDDVNGLVVMDVDVNADAVKKGIDVGDVIVAVNQRFVKDIDTIKDMIENTKRDAVLLQVNRQGRIQFVAVKLQTPDDTTE